MGKMIQARDALLRQFHADGLDVMFGNPGSTEENLLESIGADPKMHYVTGLQEASVAAMADGWARVTRKTALCQVHSTVGLGNAMGVLYEAFRAHTPMILMAGEPPVELQSFDGFLAGDLAKLAAPLTKWSERITHGRQLPRIVRRAVKVASTPPYGPVFLALPMDVLDEMVDEEDIFPSTPFAPPAACTREVAHRIARNLMNADYPMLIIGDGVAEADAREALSELASRLAIRVWGMEFNEPSISFRHPCFMGSIGHSFGSTNRDITLNGDAILCVGTPVFPELFPTTDPYFKPGALLMQIDRDAWEIAKNFPVDVAAQADPKGSLELVLKELNSMDLPAERIKKRQAEIDAEREQSLAATQASLEALPDGPDSMSPATLMRTLVEELPEGCMVYDEALTTTGELQHYLQPDKLGDYILGRGGCIGVGWPGAVGAAVAQPGRLVVAPSGDGCAMFALQTLWTAVNQKLKVLFLVCNNGAYRILKINLLNYQKSVGENPGPFPYMDIDPPRLDFVHLAKGMGMKAWRAQDVTQLRTALKEAFAYDGPTLVDAIIDGSVEQEIHDLFPDLSA